MTKTKLTLLTVLLVIVSFISYTLLIKTDFKKLATDSGFDSSWDSGGSSSDSWSSSDHGGSSGSGGSSMSPEEAAIFFYIIVTPIVGYGIRRLFRKKRQDENMLVDCVLGSAFVLPFTIIISVIVGKINNDLLLSFGVLTLIYFLINTIRNKSFGKIVAIEYITIVVVMVLLVIIGIITTNSIEPLFILLIVLQVIFPFAIFAYIFKKIGFFSNMKNQAFDDVDEFMKLNDEQNSKLLIENNIVKEKLFKDAYEIYKRVQIAWMNDTLKDVEDCLSDEMINSYDAQLSTLRRKNEQNVMSDFEYVDAEVFNVKKVNNNLEISLGLKVKCRDYLINKESGKVLRGNKNKINNYYYELVYLINKEELKQCPNCGKELERSGGTTCPYCNSKLVLNNGKMMLIKKRMLSQS